MNSLLTDLSLSLETHYEQLVVFLPKIMIAILVMLLFYFIANRSKRFVNKRLTTNMDDPLLATFLSRVVKIGLLLIGFLFALQVLGLASMATGLITGASVSAIIIGFAFKDIGENFLSGIMLAFHRPFRVGDTVELDGYKGVVVALNLRNSRIKTFDGKDIFIPNADVVKNPVVNYTMDGFLRYDFTVGLDYGSDFDKAIKIILTTMETIPGILNEQKKVSLSISNLGADALELTIYFWINTFDSSISAVTVKNQAITKVLATLDGAGFYLPGNIMELKNYKGDGLKSA